VLIHRSYYFNYQVVRGLKGGAPAKRLRVSIQDMSNRETDQETIQACFAVSHHDMESWVKTLNKERIEKKT
jgi:hypothetical protein